jgi:hypothetical protein
MERKDEAAVALAAIDAEWMADFPAQLLVEGTKDLQGSAGHRDRADFPFGNAAQPNVGVLTLKVYEQVYGLPDVLPTAIGSIDPERSRVAPGRVGSTIQG